MARYLAAAWRPVRNQGGALNPIAVCLHHAIMNGSLQTLFDSPSRQVSAHFLVMRSGAVEQYVDTNRQAWHGVAHNRFAIGVETEGCVTPPHAEPMTEAMIDAFARLYRWCHETHGIPYALANAVGVAGFTYHRAAGGPPTACPCDERLRLRPEIMRRAQGGAPAPPPLPTGQLLVSVVA